LNDDDNTVSESDREVDDGEVDITFCSQHLQCSAADEVQNRMSDCPCERDSSQQRSVPAVVKNSMSGRSCEHDSRQQCSLSAVAENSMFDRSCERDSSQRHSVLAAVENSTSGSVCEFDNRYCERPQQSVAMNEVSDRRSSQEVLLSTEQKRKRDDSCHAQLLQRDVQQGRSDRLYHAEPMLSVVEDSSQGDTCHVQRLQRDVRSGIYDGSCSMMSLQPNSENLARDVTCHTQSLQTSVADIVPAISYHSMNSRTDDVVSHGSRRQSRVMNAGRSTRQHMKYSDVESDVCSDSCDDEVEVVNSRSNALDGKQTPCRKGSKGSPPFLYNINMIT